MSSNLRELLRRIQPRMDFWSVFWDGFKFHGTLWSQQTGQWEYLIILRSLSELLITKSNRHVLGTGALTLGFHSTFTVQRCIQTKHGNKLHQLFQLVSVVLIPKHTLFSQLSKLLRAEIRTKFTIDFKKISTCLWLVHATCLSMKSVKSHYF